MARDKFAGMTIELDYARHQCRISMPSYINKFLLKFKHPKPCKRQFLPYKCLLIVYGAKQQFTLLQDTSEPLSTNQKQQIQEIVGALLYYAQAVDNKLLVALSAIAARQATATIVTEQAVHLLLNYVATYPNYGIVY